MNAFNEFGKPIDSIEEFASHLERSTREFLHDMVKKDHSATDIRATGSYLIGCVDLAVSWAILDVQDHIRKEKIRRADPNLDADEITYVQNNQKIQAIKHYRERTGQGLYESKKIVENWMQDNPQLCQKES